MAPAAAERTCAVVHLAADEAAPLETLHVVRLQRLRLRQAAESCLDPIAEEDEYAGTSSSRSGAQDQDQDDDDVPAHSSSSATVNLAQTPRR
ncbi:uncharacterized protein LOC123402086 [Hordeum vulgare subsp. vulgare]|uniref:Predicted protein n=1 Tax=Hordeum vulgare subsp. vulgare TaxID=112509 RepID=F2E890_HORVV|nr:uncharacterized protein LOC123402086 [Hordeum vulgare subsp. vulgare]BAK03562.1 predicted protein [Hordeum vulgare subsp. vulgare]